MSVQIRSARPGKSLRINWTEPAGLVQVNYYEKPGEKCQVTVQHSKLKSPEQAAAMKAYWGQALNRLNAYLVEK